MPVYHTASFQVRTESLDKCLAAIKEFIASIQANEPGTLEYVSLQQVDDPTRFLHYTVFLDQAAGERHSI